MTQASEEAKIRNGLAEYVLAIEKLGRFLGNFSNNVNLA